MLPAPDVCLCSRIPCYILLSLFLLPTSFSQSTLYISIPSSSVSSISMYHIAFRFFLSPSHHSHFARKNKKNVFIFATHFKNHLR
ncbi:MAG: hypothetical protein JOS17DRAFT_729548 [Linnemannia elongata]|nr:MAG: hypothetical protein JOS17DRAFT_729548 [Linnemannia elongata]